MMTPLSPFPLLTAVTNECQHTRSMPHLTHTHTHTHVRKPEKLLNCFIKCTNSQLIVSVEKRDRERETEKRGPK